ncbi:MAG: hypothetical protein ACI8XO_001651, partial [Verrucomicrobiales bacterium]
QPLAQAKTTQGDCPLALFSRLGIVGLWGDVEKIGGDEVGGVEDLEVRSGIVVVFGAVDDCLGIQVSTKFCETWSPS